MQEDGHHLPKQEGGYEYTSDEEGGFWHTVYLYYYYNEKERQGGVTWRFYPCDDPEYLTGSHRGWRKGFKFRGPIEPGNDDFCAGCDCKEKIIVIDGELVDKPLGLLQEQAGAGGGDGQ